MGLDANSDWTWNNKAWAVINLGEYDKTLVCSDKDYRTDSNSAWTWNNKSLALDGLKKYDEALACKNKELWR